MTAEHLLSLLVIQSVELSAVIAAVCVLSATLFRRRPHLAYALWLVVLVKAVTPPVWSCPTGVFSWALRQPPPAKAVQAPVIAADFLPPLMVHRVTEPAATVPPSPRLPEIPSVKPAATATSSLKMIGPGLAILLVWSTGAALVFVTILIMTTRLRRRVLQTAVDHPMARNLTGIRSIGKPRIVATTAPIGPALIGAWRPVIAIPLQLVDTLSVRELRAIIAHELTHHRRGDHWVAAFQRLVISIWWFNPLIWFAHWQINRARELCCDAQTVANLNCDPADYAQMLLDVLRLRRVSPSNYTLFPGVHAMQITTKRLSALMNSRAKFGMRTPVMAWAVALVGGLAIIPGSGLVPTLAADPPEKPSPATQPMGPPIVFHGVLSDLQHRWPIKGAAVTVRFQAGVGDLNRSTTVRDLGAAIVTTTAADGRFDVVVPGDLAARDPNLGISIEMDHPRYGHRSLVSRWLRGFVSEADWVRKNAPDRTTLPGLDIQLVPADELVGTLVGPDHQPLADATVSVTSMNLSPASILYDTAKTDAAGRFAVPAFEHGQTSLLFQPRDAAAFRLNSTTEAYDRRIDAGTVVAPAGRPIAGTLNDAAGKPLAGWTVEARPVQDSRLGFIDAPCALQ